MRKERETEVREKQIGTENNSDQPSDWSKIRSKVGKVEGYIGVLKHFM